MASAGGDPADRAGQAGGPGRRQARPGPRRRRHGSSGRPGSSGWSGWRVRVTASARRNGPPAGQDRPEDPATADERIEIAPDATIAVCCSGGGVRSATFNLGALQALQAKPEVFDRVTTVTAVAGGSFIAAAHALVTARSPRPAGPAAKGLDPPAYAPQSPEEQHLRDHTRYMVETWQLAVRCLAVAIRGVVINALLVGSLLFIFGLLGGRLLRLPGVGIITGLQTAHPRVDLHGWWLIPGGRMARRRRRLRRRRGRSRAQRAAPGGQQAG